CDWWGEQWKGNRPLNQYTVKDIEAMAAQFHIWQLLPAGTEGYRTAEVTLGGVDTQCLSSKTLEATQQPGLYFIGEVVDVTGQLGGFNFQWAWASGDAAGEYCGRTTKPRRQASGNTEAEAAHGGRFCVPQP